MPDISVIMPVYNARATVLRAVDSVLAQGGVDLELILVDDCSTDGSLEAVERHLGGRSVRDRSRVRVVSQPHNAGAGAARNAGIRAAGSDLVCFIDSDDEYAPDGLARLRAAMTPDVDIAVGSFIHVLPDGTERRRRPAAPGVHGGITAARLIIADRISPFPWDKLFRRSLFAGVEFPEGIINEDYLANPVLAAHARCVRVVDSPVTRYHVRGDSITWGRVPDLGEVAIAREYLERELVAAFPSERTLPRSVALADLFLTTTIAQRALIKKPQHARERDIVAQARRRISLSRAVQIAAEAPRVAAAAIGLKLAPRLYAWLYQRWIAQRY